MLATSITIIYIYIYNKRIIIVTPGYRGDQLKINLDWKNNRYLTSCSFREKMSSLRSRHLVLWSLRTLTGQHRFYGRDWLRKREDDITP
jgi:hypothetical protein